jgi:hypothetical protein
MRADLEADYMLGRTAPLPPPLTDGPIDGPDRSRPDVDDTPPTLSDRAHGVATDEFDGTAMV